MTPELALWQQLLLLGLATISLVYVLYFRIWVALAAGSDLLFVAALALSTASVVFPPLFETASRRLVDYSPLPAALAGADRRVADLEALPGRLIDRALATIGYEREIDPADLIVHEPGPFETRIRPALDSLLATVLRTTSFFCATLLLLLALALRSSTSTARQLQRLTRRLERLEAESRRHELDSVPEPTA